MRFWTHPQQSRLVQHSRSLRCCLFAGLLAMALYFNLSPSPGDGFSLIWDKALHFICWASVTGALGLAMYPWPPSLKQAFILWLIAAATETGQLWVSGRSFDPWDIVANTLGCLAALLFWQLVSYLRKRRPVDA